MNWWRNNDPRDDLNETEIKLVWFFIFIAFGIGLALLLVGCSFVELNVEQQVTSRTISEAKRNPQNVDTSVEKQGSTRNREKSSSVDAKATLTR